ncbi:MAG: hypothetical protein M1820_006990 [Bogoriella megaspora]|nr:MAG: hypothetical protein M1820_006990 [Bogoriella megaspora]
MLSQILFFAAALGAAQAQTYKASFTEYGSSDSNGSGNCNVNTVACGFFSANSYQAAASQNLFGVGPGAGAGPACGKCYKLTAQTDSSGNKLSNAGNSITVQVNNLCPANGNPLCAQSSLQSTNQYGANVNFDLCIDDGAAKALFGNSGVGLAVGTATEVACGSTAATQNGQQEVSGQESSAAAPAASPSSSAGKGTCKA